MYDFGVGEETPGIGSRLCEVLPELQRCQVAKMKRKPRTLSGKPALLQVSLAVGGRDSRAELVTRMPTWNKGARTLIWFVCTSWRALSAVVSIGLVVLRKL